MIAVSSRPTFTTWKLEQPARVVIDISGTRLGPLDVPFDAGTFAVGAVAASVSDGDGGPRTRVVLTLRRAADYDIDTQGNQIAVRVRPHDRPAPAVASTAGGGQGRAPRQRTRPGQARPRRWPGSCQDERAGIETRRREAEASRERAAKLASEKLAD